MGAVAVEVDAAAEAVEAAVDELATSPLEHCIGWQQELALPINRRVGLGLLLSWRRTMLTARWNILRPSQRSPSSGMLGSPATNQSGA